MELLQPDHIERTGGEEVLDEEMSWFLGAYIAEGWTEDNRMFLSGKDGHWKEQTKHRAAALAAEQGWATRWHRKYLAVNDVQAAALVGECGKGALNKHIPAGVLAAANLADLDDGLKLDASQNTNGDGWTLGTVSRTLAVQYRALQRMLGRSTSIKVVTNHGGFGTNPIFRVGVRSEGSAKRLRVKAIHREVEHVPCYDIQTDDHYVYLPEADCTVSNCDDMALLYNSLVGSIGIPNRFMLIGRVRKTGQMVRWVEGTPMPKNWANGKAVEWFHIASVAGWPFGAPLKDQCWAEAEPTLKGAPLGYSIVRHGVTMGQHGTLSMPPTVGKPGALSWYQGLPPNGGDLRGAPGGKAAGFYGGLGNGFATRRPHRRPSARVAPFTAGPTAMSGIPVPGFRGSGKGADAEEGPDREYRPYWRDLGVIALEAAVGGIATFLAVGAAERWMERRSRRRRSRRK